MATTHRVKTATVSKTATARVVARKVRAVPPGEGHEDTLRTKLAKVAEVDAVYVEVENGVIHVYSIVHDMGDFYERLMAQEKAVAKAWPQIRFDFHVRAHQGRQTDQAAPPFARAIYCR